MTVRFPRYPHTTVEHVLDREANTFAYAFLMPESDFRRNWEKFKGNIYLIADAFKVTPFHAHCRAKGLRLCK